MFVSLLPCSPGTEIVNNPFVELHVPLWELLQKGAIEKVSLASDFSLLTKKNEGQRPIFDLK